MTRKLHLTRDEKYVHTFISNTRLTRNRRDQAANVIKFAFKAWCLKRRGKTTSICYFQVQRKLFQAIRSFQRIQQEKRSLKDSGLGFREVINSHHATHAQTRGLVREITAIKIEVKDMKKELNSLNHNLHTLQNTLNILLDKLPNDT